MDGDAARVAFPLLSREVVLADWCDADGYANPLLVTGAYLDAAARRGVAIHPFSPVTAVTRQRDGYLVTAGQQQWSAPVLVNLTGP